MKSIVDKDAYQLAFSIAGLPKMSNQLLRGHWRVKHAHAVKWKAGVRNALKALNKPATPLERAKLTLTRHSSVAPDYDGLVSSFKSVIDGLVEEGVLLNDKMTCIGVPDYRHEVAAPRQGRITIEVREVPA